MAEISVSYTDGNPKRPTTTLTIIDPRHIDATESIVVALASVNTNAPIIDRQGAGGTSTSGTSSHTYWITG